MFVTNGDVRGAMGAHKRGEHGGGGEKKRGRTCSLIVSTVIESTDLGS